MCTKGEPSEIIQKHLKFCGYQLNYRNSNYTNHTADFEDNFVEVFKILHNVENGPKMNALSYC